MLRMLIAALLIGASLGFGLQARAADDPVDMQVVGYEKLPPGPKFSVEANANTELARNALARLKEALESRGIDYGHSAQLVMTVSPETVGGNQASTTGFDQSTAIFHLTINDTKPPLYAQVGRQYRISLDLFDRQSGRYLWRGQITDLKPDADPLSATKSMIEKLVNALVLWGAPPQ